MSDHESKPRRQTDGHGGVEEPTALVEPTALQQQPVVSTYERQEMINAGHGIKAPARDGSLALSSPEEVAGALHLAVSKGALPATGPVTEAQVHAALHAFRTEEV